MIDMLKENIFDEIDLESLSDFDLYANRIEYIDEHDDLTSKVEPKKKQAIYSAKNCLDLFF